MTTSIHLAFLNGYSPAWAAGLVRSVEASLPVEVHPAELRLDLPRYYSSERGQYNATLILAGLLRLLPDGRDRIVGVTRVDLYIPVLTFVFGQAQLAGPGALVSTYRLHNQYYGLPADEKALLERTVKEVVHEVGHTFGLVHCDQYACVMHAATYVEDVDLKTSRFCSSCSAQLEEGLATPRAAS